MLHHLHLQRRLLELDNGLRAARSPLCGRLHRCKRTHPQSLWAVPLQLRPSHRWPPAICWRPPALLVPTRSSTAAPSAALGVTWRGSDECAQAQTLYSTSSGSVGVRCSGASLRTWRRDPDERVIHPRHCRLRRDTSPCSSASSKRGRSESPPPSSAGSSGSAARTPLLLAHVQHVGRSRRTVWTGCVSIAGDVSARAGGNYTKG